MDKTFLIGVLDASSGPAVIAVPLSRALDLARTHYALQESGTWADFERLAPPEFAQDALNMWRDENETTQDPETSSAFEAPNAYHDGGWPGWLQQDMLEMFPANLQERFGEVTDSTLSGSFLHIDPKHADEVRSALETAGYTVEHDEQLVLAASGRLSGAAFSDLIKRLG